MKFFIQSLTFLLLGINSIQAQHIVKVPNIDLIAHNNETFALYEKVAEDTFKPVDLWFSNHKRAFREAIIEREDFTHTLANIKHLYQEIVWIDQLKTNGFNDLKNTQWNLKSKEFENYERTVLRFFENNLAAYYDLEFTKDDQNPEKSQWNVIDAFWYQPIILNFGNNKHIIILLERNDITYTIIPINNKQHPLMLSEEVKIQEVVPIQKKQYQTTQKNTFKDFQFSNLYKQVSKEKQSYIFDHYGNDLLKKGVDSIIHNAYYIITKKNDDYTIYTSLLEEIKIPNVKKVQLQNNFLEVLTENDAYYTNESGTIFRELPKKPPVFVCGTVNSIVYELKKDMISKREHAIKITKGGMASEYDEIKEFIFTDIKERRKISFLNNSLIQEWDDNDDYLGTIYGFPNYIKVQKGKKYGIRSYSYSMYDLTFTPDTIREKHSFKKQILHKTPAFITTEEELPIKYDLIKISEKGLILFYKKNKVGIFPQQRKPQYKLLEKVTKSFYKIIKNGKSGWLDIQTMEEFFFE